MLFLKAGNHICVDMQRKILEGMLTELLSHGKGIGHLFFFLSPLQPPLPTHNYLS